MSIRGWLPVGGARGPVYRTGVLDRVLVAGKQLPGEVRVNAKIKVKEDAKKAAGKNGGQPTVHGLDGQAVEISVKIWTDEQMEAFDEMMANILPFVGYSPSAYTIDAAALRSIKIKAIIIVGASSWKESTLKSGARCLEMTLDCKHWINDQKPASVSKKIDKKQRRDGPDNDRTGTTSVAKKKPSGDPNTYAVTETFDEQGNLTGTEGS